MDRKLLVEARSMATPVPAEPNSSSACLAVRPGFRAAPASKLEHPKLSRRRAVNPARTLRFLLQFPFGLLIFLGLLLLPARLGAQNPTQVENAKPGSPDWQLTNPATNHEIEGYASLVSVGRGGQISFFINTADPTFTLEIFRMGWYRGDGARLGQGGGGSQGAQRAQRGGAAKKSWPHGGRNPGEARKTPL